MKIKSVEEIHYGFSTKYLVTYEDGTWEWKYQRGWNMGMEIPLLEIIYPIFKQQITH